MPRGKVRDRDGVFVRQGSFYISFIDAQGCRQQRKLKGAYTLTQARDLRAAERQKVEKAQTLGYAPPTKETFAEIVHRYLNHQKSRLTPAAYRRSQGIIETHLKSEFGQRRLAGIRRIDVQKYITERSTHVAPGSVIEHAETRAQSRRRVGVDTAQSLRASKAAACSCWPHALPAAHRIACRARSMPPNGCVPLWPCSSSRACAARSCSGCAG